MTDASFEPYGRLLRVLLPSMRGMVVHDAAANVVWSVDEWEIAERFQIAKQAISAAVFGATGIAGLLRTIDADRAVYSYVIRGEGSRLLGVVSLVVPVSAKTNEVRPLKYVTQLLTPALDCLRHEMLLRLRLGSREQDLNGRERDLSLMLEMSSRQPATASDADEFDLILKTGLEHLQCALAALWVPEKGMSLSITKSGGALAPEALQRARTHLMDWMLLQQRTMVINRISKYPTDGAAPYKILACPVRHSSERVIGVLALFNPPSAADFDAQQTRLAELLAKKATLVIQSQYDAGTGLMTAHAFERQVRALCASPHAHAHAVLYLDIDRLHEINEKFGMQVGDEIINSVALRLAKTLPPGALSARVAGDRLAALIPETGMAAAAAVAENVRAAVAAIEPPAGLESCEISASLGVAPLGRAANALAHALATAELACKAAKDRGRNRVEVSHETDGVGNSRNTDLVIVGTLRDALEHGRFRLDAQPILPLRASEGPPRFELLIRMIGDRGEMLQPGKFLPTAARHHLLPAIDRWVVRHACECLGRYAKSMTEDSARFAVNLSGPSLEDESFAAFVMGELERAGVHGNVLCFELTETAALGNLAGAQHFIHTLRQIGCSFALDDFGTGASSLAHLKDLSIDHLKIDGTLVRDALANPRAESIIRAVAQLAKVMAMETIAEFVETDSLRLRMADLGVDYGQGFAMGRSRRFEELLADLALFEASVSNRSMPGAAVADAGTVV